MTTPRPVIDARFCAADGRPVRRPRAGGLHGDWRPGPRRDGAQSREGAMAHRARVLRRGESSDLARGQARLKSQSPAAIANGHARHRARAKRAMVGLLRARVMANRRPRSPSPHPGGTAAYRDGGPAGAGRGPCRIETRAASAWSTARGSGVPVRSTSLEGRRRRHLPALARRRTSHRRARLASRPASRTSPSAWGRGGTCDDAGGWRNRSSGGSGKEHVRYPAEVRGNSPRAGGSPPGPKGGGAGRSRRPAEPCRFCEGAEAYEPSKIAGRESGDRRFAGARWGLTAPRASPTRTSTPPRGSTAAR